MATGEYISEKLKSFQKKHYYSGYLVSNDPEIKRMWQNEQNNENKKWRDIKNNQDVLKMIDSFESSVNYVEKYVKQGNLEDG